MSTEVEDPHIDEMLADHDLWLARKEMAKMDALLDWALAREIAVAHLRVGDLEVTFAEPLIPPAIRTEEQRREEEHEDLVDPYPNDAAGDYARRMNFPPPPRIDE